MALKDEYAKAYATGTPVLAGKTIHKLDNCLSRFCDELDGRISRLLTDAYHGQARGEKMPIVEEIRCNASDAALAAMIPYVKYIGDMPSFKRLAGLCANPARDACCQVTLKDFVCGGNFDVMLEIRIDPEKTFRDSSFSIYEPHLGPLKEVRPFNAPAAAPAAPVPPKP